MRSQKEVGMMCLLLPILLNAVFPTTLHSLSTSAEGLLPVKFTTWLFLLPYIWWEWRGRWRGI